MTPSQGDESGPAAAPVDLNPPQALAHPAARAYSEAVVSSQARVSSQDVVTPPDRARPAALVLHLCLLLSGLATALLGPILPLLSQRWHLSDQQTGLLLLAQFCGATTGGLTISKHLRRSLLASA